MCPLDTPDPFVLVEEDRYLAFATQAGTCKVQVLASADLVHWEHLGDALAELPAWSAPGRTWSPAVLRRGEGYRCYYATAHRASDRQAISVASASAPAGPYQDASSAPLIFQVERGGSIDPSPFVDVDGVAYLCWKSDDNALGRASSLWIQRLSEDGLRLEGAAGELLCCDRGWEQPLIEAPTMVHVDGRYHLLYSANWWGSANYGIGHASAESVLGPFTKHTRRGPWLTSGSAGVGPGGQEVFTDRSGDLRLAYHAWDPTRVGYQAGGVRSLRIARLAFADGRPVVASC